VSTESIEQGPDWQDLTRRCFLIDVDVQIHAEQN
jgi:hypothetical protein